MDEINDWKVNVMEISEYKNIFQNEESHFYYVSTHKLIVGLLDKYGPADGKRKIVLDAGCGTGQLARLMSTNGNVVIAVDKSPTGVKLTKTRGVSARRASVEKLPFRSRRFDVVTCIDVLYHRFVRSEKNAIKEMYRVLKPGGLLVIRVPAFSWLITAHDKQVFTQRRFRYGELKLLLDGVGLKTEFLSYVHLMGGLFLAVKHLLERITGTSQTASVIGNTNPLVNKLLTWVLVFEASVLETGISLPFGSGLIAVARKPNGTL